MRRRRLGPADVTELDGLPVTSLARTWVDLAEVLSAADLLAAGDAALRRGAHPAELDDAVNRLGRRRGIVRARQIAPLLDARAESRAESHLRWTVVGAGLPPPQVNVAIYSSTGEWLARPDLSYDDVRLALEYNGADHADPNRMRRDITRDLDVLDRGGWLSVTFGPDQVFRRPDQIGVLVARLRRQRAALFRHGER